jgi:NAD+-dependent farnesol dehydrogenase
MKILVTGATGYIGIPLVQALAGQGISVRALVRSEARSREIAGHRQIELVTGDLSNPVSLRKAIRGCEEIFHLAAFAGIWTKDPAQYHRINVQGTSDLLSIALEEGIHKVVITSTAGVMGPSPLPGIRVSEETSGEPLLFSPYDQSKLQQEKTAFSFSGKGMEVVVVNPSRIYGPGLVGESNSVSRLVHLFSQGKWRFIPGNGASEGNYVYIDDVVNGHLLAMQKGVSGQRYILGGDNISYNDFFDLLRKLTRQNHKLIKIPVKVLLGWAQIEILRANITGKKPMIVPAFVEKLTHNWNLTSEKAIRDLGYRFTTLETGLSKTLDWIKS